MMLDSKPMELCSLMDTKPIRANGQFSVIAVSCTQDQCLSVNYIMLTPAVTRLVVIKRIYSR